MQFRWIVAIALWTLLAGPIFAPLSLSSSRPHPSSHGAAQPRPPRTPVR